MNFHEIKSQKDLITYFKETSHFWDKDTLKFWGSKMHVMKKVDNRILFITSELDYGKENRRYTLRVLKNNRVRTIGHHRQYESLSEAKKALEKIL